MDSSYDYTRDYAGGEYGLFEPDPGGITLLDDDDSLLKLDDQLGEDLHPRNQGISKRQQFSIGAGRREGFTGKRERFDARENFTEREKKAYIQGKWPVSERGVKSVRDGIVQLENDDWDPRPPHYNGGPNEDVHLFMENNPGTRGYAIYPGNARMKYDKFVGGPEDQVVMGNLSIINIVLFMILVLVISMYASFSVGIKIGKRIRQAKTGGGLSLPAHQHPASIRNPE
jgi:hypothetical protein